MYYYMQRLIVIFFGAHTARQRTPAPNCHETPDAGFLGQLVSSQWHIQPYGAIVIAKAA
jgi:hypothetical protein